MTDKKTDPDDVDAVVDRLLMARGAGRTVKMMKVAEFQQLEHDLFEARHKAQEWEESHNIERDRATALEAECERLRRQMDHATPWRVGDPPTDEEMRAIRLRWANGPEKYQADADALIAAVIHGRQRETELQAILTGRTTPPTGPEMVAHEAARGLWRWVSTMDGAVIHGCSEDGARWIYGDPMEGLPKRIGSVYETRYWALNAKRELCAWPKVPHGRKTP